MTATAAETGAPARAAAPPVYRDALDELRALRRQGLGTAVARVRELLGKLADAADREAAGMLLGGRAARAALDGSGAFTPVTVGLLAGSTVDALPPLLTAALMTEGVRPETVTTGYNQWRFEVLAGAPTLKDAAPLVTACLLDGAAVLEKVTDPLDADEVEARCAAFPAELDAWLAAYDKALGTLAVLNTVPMPALLRDRYIDYPTKARVESAWHRMNAGILDLSARPGAVVLSADGLADRAGSGRADDRMRHLAAHAWSTEFLDAYARELGRIVLARLGRAKKVLVLDLDHTLWGGIVGDDGIGSLKIGGGFPGSAHVELQSLAKDLSRQGVVLAVCSKNDDAVAREAVATHPEMVLRPGDFSAFRANWEPKPGNVASIAAELNLGTDAMVFVDDNPAERGLMARTRPEVAVVELDADPAGYARALAEAGWFNQLALTEEDRTRAALYRARARRDELRESTGDIEAYLRELATELTVEEYRPLNATRIAQLFGKTNQFNLTGIRYGTDELARRSAEGTAAFFGIRVTDAFGDNGLVGALAVTAAPDGGWLVENFVLSCRVFSRSVEDAVVGTLLRAARAAGAPAVHGRHVPTAKNGRFAGFYPALGFAGHDGEFRHDLTQLAELPDWVRIGTGEGKFHAP
ncbi:HAD-IIIC family phosphatase [Streptomyces sp. AM 2-1-1]|uniref:HAD-IIIC family phosphatase n=1 Tax=Streptomyces sp. AM 2-1-1 TaxID=3028709 RepID=UPI0023B908FA|nr:HAD-IIIC family phosphatase [Streptomyces sp. AM 2-1-1]WEH39059.1 HAD-IIIC family phosphatase [Streptomyces sp. AM 2-1-1]